MQKPTDGQIIEVLARPLGVSFSAAAHIIGEWEKIRPSDHEELSRLNRALFSDNEKVIIENKALKAGHAMLTLELTEAQAELRVMQDLLHQGREKATRLGVMLNEREAQLKEAREALPVWIPVSERWPVMDDADLGQDVLWMSVNEGISTAAYNTKLNREYAAYWLPLKALANLPKREPVKEEVKPDPEAAMRAEFEAWASEPGRALDLRPTGTDGYLKVETHFAWKAWKAAKKGGPSHE